MFTGLFGTVDRCSNCGTTLGCNVDDFFSLRLDLSSAGPQGLQNAIISCIRAHQHDGHSIENVPQCQNMACSTSPLVRQVYLGRTPQYFFVTFDDEVDVHEDNIDVTNIVDISAACFGREDARYEIAAYITADSAATVNLSDFG